MIRTRTGHFLTSGALPVVLCALLAVAIASPSHASDNDGISGYSIRLKNKDFDGSNEGGSGGGLLAFENDTRPRVSEPSVVPQASASVGVFTSALRLYLERWYSLWLR